MLFKVLRRSKLRQKNFRLIFHKSRNSLFFYPFYSFCFHKIFCFFSFRLKAVFFSLQDFCLARVPARFLLIFKYPLITCCQTNKQIKTGGKNNLCVATECKLICLGCDAKDCKHYTLSFKIYKS